MSCRRGRLPAGLLPALLLAALVPAAGQEAAPPAPGPQAPAAAGASAEAPPAMVLASLRVTGWEGLANAGADPARLRADLLEHWGRGYASRVVLLESRVPRPAGALTAELEASVTADGFRTRVSLAPASGRKLEARATIHGHEPSALLSTLAGDLFFLWAQAGGFTLQPTGSPPPLGSWLALDSLELLPGWRAAEALDCAASADGPVLLFADRLLSLGRSLDIAPATAEDLLLRAPLPSGYRPDRLWLDPLGRPVLFSAATGELLSCVEGLPPELRPTGLRQPVHAAFLPTGGLAMVASGRITRALRRGGSVRREQLPLPGGFYGAVEGDAEGRLWVLDLVERRVRILDERGREVRALKPALDPYRLPFPQVFLPLADGGLLLGGAGELWRFDRWGAPVWLMQSVFTGVREALPPYFRLALCERGRTGGQGPSGCTLYLLDPQGRRLFRFDDPGPAPGEPPLAEPASQLPALVALLQTGEVGGRELAQYALDQGLPLLARTFLRDSLPESVPAARLARVAKARLLRGLVELADRAETQLRLQEAEAALREAARLSGELRAVDPEEPSYARELPGLVARRARLREELLEPGEQGLQAVLEPASPGVETRAVLSLSNSSLQPAESVSVQLRWAGFPPGAAVEWMQPIRPGYTARLPLPLPAGLPGYAEELSLRLSVLVSWQQEGRRQRRFLQAAYLLPPARQLAKAE